MWAHEYAFETDAPPAAIWAVLSDINAWTAWDTSMESVSLLGGFGVGEKVAMTPIGQDEIVSTIVAIDENRFYADETEFQGVTLRFSHKLEATDSGGTRVTHRLEISGDGADEIGPEIGPGITADFPEAMATLVSRACR